MAKIDRSLQNVDDNIFGIWSHHFIFQHATNRDHLQNEQENPKTNDFHIKPFSL